MRARGLISGEENVIAEIPKGNIKYIFLAKDASEATKKKIKSKADFYHIELSIEYTSFAFYSKRKSYGIRNYKSGVFKNIKEIG